jgi:hypothetical protein
MKIIPLPVWLQEMPPGPRKTIAMRRFFLRLASIYATEDGRFFKLAQILDINRKTFLSQMTSNLTIPQNTVNGIRQILYPITVPDLTDKF